MDHDLKVWKILRSQNKPINEFGQTREIPLEIWETHFTDLSEIEEVINITEQPEQESRIRITI